MAAKAPIGPLAWEPLYAAGAALGKTKKKKKKKEKINSAVAPATFQVFNIRLADKC